MAVRTETTRRALLGGAGLIAAATLPAFAAVMPTSTTVKTSATVSPRLARLIALHDRAEAECERFDVEVEMPARRAYNAALQAQTKEEEPPHEEVATTFVNAFGDTVRLSTSRVGTCAVAAKVATDPTWADMGDADWRQANLELFEADNRRRAIIDKQLERRKAADDVIRRRFRMDDLLDRVDALAERRDRLWGATLDHPAASIADVIAKLDLIKRTHPEDDPAEYVFAAIAKDVRALAGEARA
jgi:hypothetical protein